MKKTILAALAVLLAIMAVTCDSFAPDADKAPARHTEDGRLLVDLEINAPKLSRALTLDLAKNNVTFYEVAFKDAGGTRIYRTAWNYTQTGRIAVPAGTYTGAANAVLFAGRGDDKTLLAVGAITAVDGVADLTGEIKPNTSNVTFTLVPLKNDISTIPNNVTSPPAPVALTASTFQITGPAGYLTSAYASASVFPTVTMEVDQKTYPLYRVPLNSAAITATYRIDCGAAGANYAGVIIQPPPSPATAWELISGPATNISNGVKVTGTVLPAGASAIATTGTVVPASGIFNITIDTTGTEVADGLSKISIEVPVCAIDIAKDYPGTWYIRGGLKQDALDKGITENTIGSLGGAVLLGVGAVKETGLTINTTW